MGEMILLAQCSKGLCKTPRMVDDLFNLRWPMILFHVVYNYGVKMICIEFSIEGWSAGCIFEVVQGYRIGSGPHGKIWGSRLGLKLQS